VHIILLSPLVVSRSPRFSHHISHTAPTRTLCYTNPSLQHTTTESQPLSAYDNGIATYLFH
jgi:hypothetical protein